MASASGASILGNSIDGGILNASGTGDVEMAKALSSYKIRNEQYKNLYEGMKQQYAQLADEYEDSQKRLERAAEESHLMQEKFRNLLEKLQTENREKQNRMEEMKTQVNFDFFC